MTTMVSNTTTTTDRLSAVFAALGDPTRRTILARLAAGEASVAELARPFDMTARAVSKHLRVLEAAGLVSSGRDAQRRPRRLEAAPLEHAAAWLDQYRAFWEASFDRLQRYASELQQKRKVPRKARRHGRR